MKADLHNHLRTSSNIRKSDFNKAINLATERLGRNCMFGIVDFADRRYQHFIELSSRFDREYIGKDKRGVRVYNREEDLNVVVVHGEEVPTKQGHLLVMGLGVNAHLKHNKTIEDTIKEAKDYNPDVTLISDHPFGWKGVGEYIKSNLDILGKIDAIEGFNAEAIGSNKKALDFYKSIKTDFPNVGFISTSDGHSWYEFCRNWSELDNNLLYLTPEDIFSKYFREAVKKTDEYTPRQTSVLTGLSGAVDHIADLVFIVKIAPKIGLGKLFETDIPKN